MENSELGLLQGKFSFSLYVHIPFCRKKCSYCDFFSISDVPVELIHRVLKETLCELEFFTDMFKGSECKTIYIGGGTPSLLNERDLSLLLKSLSTYRSVEEWTIEANPESLNREFLDICRESGVNRLSLGLQTYKQDLLNTLTRFCSADDNYKALELIEKHWQGKVNIDLMTGIPGQSESAMKEDIRLTMEQMPGHISLYSLIPPEGSVLEKKIIPDYQDTLWLKGFKLLESSNYLNYEISNFTFPHQECLHNLNVWDMEPYLGIGPGAVSTLPGYCGDVKRLSNPEDISKFLLGEKEHWSLQAETISPRDFLFENLMMGFRKRRGLDKSKFLKRFGRPLPDIIPEIWKQWDNRGLISSSKNCYALTDSGRLMLDSLLAEMQEAISKIIPNLDTQWSLC